MLLCFAKSMFIRYISFWKNYFITRRKGEAFARMHNDKFTTNKNNYIRKSKLCYVVS